MKFLITGHRGYLGEPLVRLMKEHGHWVAGCDINYFEGCEWEARVKPDREWVMNFMDLALEHLEGIDCICHLAAISNDPMGELNQALTYKINEEGSILLAKKAKQAGVKRFLFSGSCSVYGKGTDNERLDEESLLKPISVYAKSKVNAERAIRELANDDFTPVFLRNGTAYGHSPSMRIDLVVNNLLACGIALGEVRIMSDGSPWRPLIHCKDIGRAFIALARAKKEGVSNQCINIGEDLENYRVRDIGDKVKALLPHSKIVYTKEVGADPRDYRVSFGKLKHLVPEFKLEYTLERGMEELARKYRDFGFGVSDFRGSRFIRVLKLKEKLFS